MFPVIGSTPIADVQPADIRNLVKGIEARGAAETAGRVFQRLRAVFRFAIAHDVIAIDPTYPPQAGGNLQAAQGGAPGRRWPNGMFRCSFNGWAAYQGDPTTAAALSLLMLTALRPGELRGARWDEIDTERALWRVPAERMKMKTEHVVPLSKQAIKVIEAMRPLSGRGALVLPSPFYPGKPLSDGTLNSALARMGYKGIATAHGFRTLFSTCANEGGWNSDYIEKQLAHEDRDDVRGAYNRAQWLSRTRKDDAVVGKPYRQAAQGRRNAFVQGGIRGHTPAESSFAAPSPRLIPEGENRVPLPGWRGT